MDQMYETNESQQPDNIVETPRVNVEILAKWIRVLFWISIASVAAGGLTGDAMKELALAVSIVGDIIIAAVSAVYAVVLFKIASEEEDYRKAAIFRIPGIVFSIAMVFLPDYEDNLGIAIGALILSLLAMVLDLVSSYYEYGAHASVLARIDVVMSEKWERLWRWTIGMTVGMMVCLIFAVIAPFFGLLLLLAAGVGMLVIGIMRLVYLFQTGNTFKNYGSHMSQ